MSPPRRSLRSRVRAAVLLAGASCFVLGAGAVSAGDAELPKGLPVGPWILTPSVEAGYSYYSNVFWRSASSVPPPFSDQAMTATPKIRATLPFSQSSLAFDYTATWLNYQKTKLTRNLSQEGGADLTLRFSTGDRFGLEARKILGVAETLAFDPGGEVVFQGDPFDLVSYQIEGAREILGRRGYQARVRWSELTYPESPSVAFFQFRGYEGELGYREPLGPRIWLTADYGGRRFDHFQVVDPSTSGLPNRSEESDLLWVGVAGQFLEEEPYHVRLGWARFDFPGSGFSNFRGVVGDAAVSLKLGASTSVTVTFDRRPWPSFFENNNYYLVTGMEVRAEKRWLQESAVGASLYVQGAEYGDRLPSGVHRVDRTLRAELYANLMILGRFGFRISLSENQRTSNLPGADYDGRIYFGGFVWGWM